MASEAAEGLLSLMETAEDGAARAQLASELSHALVLGQLSAAEADRASRLASRKQAADDDLRAQGYWEAIRDLAGAAASALEHSDEQRELELEVERRPMWKAILAALHDRPRTPTELAPWVASGLERDDGRVKRQLDQMAALDLVEAGRKGRDGRTRPRQLTPRGHRLAARMPNRVLDRNPVLLDARLRVARSVVSMIRLLGVSSKRRPVHVRELAACAGPRNSDNEAFARAVAFLCEARGLVDVQDDESVLWERKHDWRRTLENVDPRALDLAFSHVPSHFMLCTDRRNLDPWREALRWSPSPRVAEVCPATLAIELLGTGEWSAVVMDDPTFARSLRDAAAGKELALFVVGASGIPPRLTVREAA